MGWWGYLVLDWAEWTGQIELEALLQEDLVTLAGFVLLAQQEPVPA